MEPNAELRLTGATRIIYYPIRVEIEPTTDAFSVSQPASKSIILSTFKAFTQAPVTLAQEVVVLF